ncbi:Neu5Ac permease [Kluyvera cryocrescens]|uniref:Neu5Ac permease n=1 Tax=Kluyvera cryocrescens TaxID=580 RepID=A0A485CEW2_KLUCR|nr:Neu5Ac permease [Kluyvera cryocrescens]
MIPEMDKKGYPRDFAAAVTASGSVQAILTPPSHNSVIYSLATGGTVSIAALFIAGILPGLLLSFTLMVMCVGFAHKRGLPERRARAVSPGAKDFRRYPVGIDDRSDHHGRHPLRHFHRHRICGDCLPVVVLCDHVYLP